MSAGPNAHGACNGVNEQLSLNPQNANLAVMAFLPQREAREEGARVFWFLPKKRFLVGSVSPPAFGLKRRGLLEAFAFRVCGFQAFQIFLFAGTFYKALLSVNEVEGLIQVFFAGQLLLETAPLLDCGISQTFKVLQRKRAMAHYLTGRAFAPVFRISARSAGYVARPFSRHYRLLCLALAAATSAFPILLFRHAVHYNYKAEGNI